MPSTIQSPPPPPGYEDYFVTEPAPQSPLKRRGNRSTLLRVVGAIVIGIVGWGGWLAKDRPVTNNDPGCIAYREAAEKSGRGTLSSDEAVQAFLTLSETTELPEVKDAVGRLINYATTTTDAPESPQFEDGIWAYEKQIVKACGLEGYVEQ
jgi:hypothetical protein